MNIIYASDDNYVPYLLTSMSSLCYNNDKNLNVFILDNNITKINKNKINSLMQNYSNLQITFIDCNSFSDKLNLPSFQLEGIMRMNVTTYFRLFIASVLPDDIDKILYIDCDALVLQDITELYDINIKDYMAAGVLDCASLALREVINFNENDNYVNAGLLLINLKKWRENDVEKEFMNFFEENKNRSIHHDQGIINAVLKNQIKIIHPKYNFLGYFLMTKKFETILKWNGFDDKKYYNTKILSQAKDDTVILHCKPWESPEIYKKYSDMIPEIDKTILFEVKSNKSFFGSLFEKFNSSSLGNFILDITPKKIAINLKNFIVRRQLSY